jgi:YD repeat-containing protein
MLFFLLHKYSCQHNSCLKYLHSWIYSLAQRWVFKATCILFLWLYPIVAFCASGSVSASVGSTVVTLNATGSFIVDTHCDTQTPPVCWDHSGGNMTLLLNSGSLQGEAFTGGSGTLNATLNRYSLSNGTHTASVSVSDAHESSSNSSTFTIDNTPTVSFSSPAGVVRGGPTALAGTVQFVGGSDGYGNFGSVYVYSRVAGSTGGWSGLASHGSAAATYDLSNISLPTHTWADGDYEIRVTARALNSTTAEQIANITINNSPEITLSLSSNQIGDCDNITGSVNVISHDSSPNGGTIILTLPDGTSAASSFVGAGATLTFADFGLPDGYSATGFANQSMNFSATVTTAGNRTNSDAATASVILCPPPPVDTEQSNPEGGEGCISCSCKQNQTSKNPIRLSTGNKEESESDFSIGGLSLTRSYHSQSNHDGRMGYGWTYSYGWKLTPPATGQITIRRAGGKLMTFNDDGTGIFVRQLERSDETVVSTATGFRYTHHDLSTVDFDTAGNLVSLNSEDGRATTVAYDASGNPVSITGPFGRSVAIAVDANGHISTITGPLGRVWSYGYDANNNLISVTYPDGTSRQYVYGDVNDVHNLTQVIDEAGRTYKSIAYDALDRATLSSLPLTGYQDTVTYNGDGTVSLTESDGTVRNYTVTDVNGISMVTAVSDSSCNCGSATSFIFDPVSGLLAGDSDKNGVSNSYTYDANGRMLTKTEAVGTLVERTTTYSYDVAGHVASVTDGLSNVTNYTYDASGHVLTVTDALGNTTTNSWNANGTLASITDVAGNTTAYTYDGFGQVVSITNPDLSTRLMSYDGAGRIISVTDESGSTTTYTYDVRDRVISISYPDGTTTINSYDTAGDLVSSTDAAGLVTTYTYDVEHRPLTMIRPDGTTVTSTFDAKGNLTARDIKDAAGVSALTEAMAYDADGRVTSTTYADATSASNTYDMLGRLLTSTDEVGKVSSRTYDELGRLASVSNANGEIATYAYDAADRLIRATDAGGVTTTFAFDAAGRLTDEASSDRSFTDYAYNSTGDLISKTDGNGVITSYTYDARHRMTSISYPADPTRNVSFTYDGAGRLNGMTDISGTTTYTHNVMGRVTSASWTPAGSALTLVLAYNYDASGRLASLTYPTGRVVTYAYDSAGRIDSVDASANGSPVNLASTITYDALGNITSRTLGNGIVETHSIDSRGRVVTIDAAGVMSRSLTWSADSTITAIADNIDFTASQSFAYDLADRLTSASGGYGNISYAYDANGNRTGKTDAAGTVSSAYEAATNRLASSGSATYTRDAAGNRLSDGTLSYTYAVNNRLISVADSTTGALLADYQHNGKGERVSKTVDGVTTWFVYDLSGNLIGEYNSDGVMIAEHLYGPSGRIVTIRNQQVPVAVNQSDLPTIQYAGVFGFDVFIPLTQTEVEAGRRAS